MSTLWDGWVTKGKKRYFLSFVLLWCLVLWLPSLPAQAKVSSYPSPKTFTDVNPTLAGPVLDLGGGGTDVEEALQSMIDGVRGCSDRDCKSTVDVVVIRFEPDDPEPDEKYDGYNDLIYKEMGHIGVNSVETLVFQREHPEDANDPNTIKKIKNAEVVFFAGGDQCNYVRNFQNTPIKAAIKSVYAKGGGIGGTSAGAMIQGNFIFNACTGDTVETLEARQDPYEDIFLTDNFFEWKYLQDTIIDTHFAKSGQKNRDRMGRSMVFVARLLRDGLSQKPLAIGISAGTSVIVDPNGLAKVMGKGAAYFILSDHLPEECEPQTPLTFSDYKIWKVNTGETFNLKKRPETADYFASITDGELDSNPY